MIRILHTADLHLGAPLKQLGSHAEARREDFCRTFERLLTLAIKNEVHLFLVAGDLFDHPQPGTELIGRVQSGFKRLADRGITPVVIPGTHDNVVSADSVFRRHEFPGAVVLKDPAVEEPVSLTIQGERIFLYGFAYRSSASEDALTTMQRRCEEGIHIGLLHGSREGSPEWDYRKKDLPFTTPLLKTWDLDYVALGHYHDFDLINDAKRIWACYPGSPEGKRFGENGPRYCVRANITPRQVEVEKLECQSRILEAQSLDLSGCSGEQDAAEKIAALADNDLLLRLTLTGIVETPLDLNRLQGLTAQHFFYLELQDRTHLFDSAFARRIEEENTVRGLFVRRARERMAEASDEEKEIIELAFREVLVRFHAFGGGDA